MSVVALQYTTDQIQQMRSAVRTRLLGEAPYVRHANFTTLGTQDLRLLFRLYDEIFFTDQLQPMVMQHCGRPLQFRVSRAMTSAGGKTIWSKVRGKTISFEIAISTSLLFNSFRDDARPIHVSGQLCSDRVDALMRVMEHEIVHLLEMLTFGKSSCSQTRFLTIAGRLFGHTHPRHGLVTARENAHRQHDIRVGQQVSFRFQGRELTGIVNRIQLRASVLVPDKAGRRYSDGNHYAKYLIRLAMLTPKGSAQRV